jgi:hypothetical protein
MSTLIACSGGGQCLRTSSQFTAAGLACIFTAIKAFSLGSFYTASSPVRAFVFSQALVASELIRTAVLVASAVVLACTLILMSSFLVILFSVCIETGLAARKFGMFVWSRLSTILSWLEALFVNAEVGEFAQVWYQQILTKAAAGR